MKPKSMMIFGVVSGILWLGVEIAGFNGGQIPMLMFASGMLFGKGYGVWEERDRNKEAGR